MGVTDFEAAFDYISGRQLFIKLADLGIGICLLSALISMYEKTDAYVLLEKFSEFVNHRWCLTGICIVHIVVHGVHIRSDQNFREYFPSEEIISLFYILLHAADSLISTTRKA